MQRRRLVFHGRVFRVYAEGLALPSGRRVMALVEGPQEADARLNSRQPS
jgi:hypothetical protein